MTGKVTVIGAGLAGLSATLTLARAGVGVTLVSAQQSERSQSVMAEGGINAALDLMGEHDAPELHFFDTMKSAAGLADPNAVWGLTSTAPDIVRDLISFGVPFQVEQGKMVQRAFGGQRRRRTNYAKSSTGKALVSALIDAVRRYEAQGVVTRLAHHELAWLSIADGTCAAAQVRDAYTGALTALPAPIILATGGLSGLYGPRTTGTTVNTGDVTALCLAFGVELANLEYLQYHPTTVAIPGKRMLISEAARGEGGRLCALRGGTPWYFMEERYPELGNLMPRDVVSREEASVIADPGSGGQVYLDLRGLSKHVWAKRLSDLRDECRHYLGIDPAKELMPVEPGIHYSMGGLLVDEGHRTNVAGLLAAGECCSQYHGANRLGGNSLLGALYGGRVAATTALDLVTDAPARVAAADADHGRFPLGPLDQVPSDLSLDHAVQEILARSMGILRDGPSLAAGLAQLEELDTAQATPRLRNRVLLARAAVSCALARRECRGAHWRTDYPGRHEEFAKTTVVRMKDGALEVLFRELPAARADVPQEEGGAA